MLEFPTTSPASAARTDPDTAPGEDGADDGAQGVASPGDSSLDVSLRMLTVLVLFALAGSVSLLAYRWIAPGFSLTDSTRVTTQRIAPPPAPAEVAADPAKGDEVLMAPGHVFRCTEQGRVTFSDRACPGTTTGTR